MTQPVLATDEQSCKQAGLALKDAISLLSGKWKFCILLNLSTNGLLRFKDLLATVDGITPKVLAKELQELEANRLLIRRVNDTKPVSVSYSLTEHAQTVRPVLAALVEFGLAHRRKYLGTESFSQFRVLRLKIVAWTHKPCLRLSKRKS